MASRPLPLAGRAGVCRACTGACVLALLAGCGGGGAGLRTNGTVLVYGTVMRGPTSPVCRAGKPCTAPASGTELAFTKGSSGVHAVVAKDGSYFVSLAPGTYAVTALSQQLIGRGIEPSSIVVRTGPRQKRDFRIDTGIR